MNTITVSCDVCGHVFEVSLPPEARVTDFKTIEHVGEFGIIGGLRGLKYDRKVHCPECRSIIGIKYTR